MIYPHNQELANKYSLQAIERIQGYGLAATPNNYELLYVYFAQENQDVVRAIDFLLQNNDKLTQEQCNEIFDSFLSNDRAEEHVRKAGDELQNTIRSVKDAVQGVQSATLSYNDTLTSIDEKLAGTPSPEDIKEVVSVARANTQQVITHNQNLEAALEQSTSEIEKLREDLEKVKKESLTDSLTGLSNRKAFDTEAQRALDEAVKENSPFSLLMLDIDHFKSFNDNFGHQVGDQVLRLVAKCLTDGVKGKDFAARYGGEEFVIILPETELAAGVAVGNNLRKTVANKDVINRNSGDKLGRITMSVGVAEFSGTESVEDLIGRADAALYTAKHNGRNQVAAAPTPGATT